MAEEKKKKEEEKTGTISRREFLKDAGLVVGGASIGSMSFLNACSNAGATATTTQTVTKTSTVTVTAPGGTVPAATVTVTSPTVSKVVEVAPAGMITLNVNGNNYQIGDVKPYMPLAFVLREKLGLTGTKIGCDRGECGVCTIIVDGKNVLACTIPAVEAEGTVILTIEGLAKGGKLDPLQQLFYDEDAFQCGYCTPGFIMAAKVLLAEKPKPTSADIREALSGHCCSCGGANMPVRALLKGVA